MGIKFEVDRASNSLDTTEIKEFETLKDLTDFIDSVKESVIITTINYPEKADYYLMIYDENIE